MSEINIKEIIDDLDKEIIRLKAMKDTLVVLKDENDRLMNGMRSAIVDMKELAGGNKDDE